MAQAAWTTADYALIVSICSAALSLFSLGWNIWSKFIYPKPQLRVTIRTSMLVGTVEDLPLVVTFSATNHGPGDLALQGVVGRVKKRFPWSKQQRALLVSYANWPQTLKKASLGECPGLPARLGVGETYQLHFPTETFSDRTVVDLCIVDGFGREHWSSGRSRQHLKVDT